MSKNIIFNQFACFSFCEKCFKRGMPKEKDLFVYFNENRNNYSISSMKHQVISHGFTPHLFLFNNFIDNSLLTYKAYCTICDMEIILKEDKKNYTVKFLTALQGVMKIENWKYWAERRIYSSKT